MPEKGKPKVSFRISQEKLNQIDSHVKPKGSFKNRSELILNAIELLVKQKVYKDLTDFTRKAIQNQLKAEGIDPAKVFTGNEGN